MRNGIWAAIVIALAVALIFGIGRGGDAEQERQARQAAEQAAQEADRRATAAWAARDSVQQERDSLKAAYADSLTAARERSQADVREANERTRRLRDQLTSEQQAELDGITAFWEQAVAEERSATDAALGQLRLAEAEAADNLALAMLERDRADSWRTAYETAVAEIDALRRPDFFSIKLENVPQLVAAAAVGYLAGR